MTDLKLGLALGSGAARGWAHIGVIHRLTELGLRPQVVTGASIGSLVGAAYASGQLEVLEQWIAKLRWLDVLTMFDTTLGRGGFISGNKLMNTISGLLEDHPIESLPIGFGAVATDLQTGGEVWLREGSMLEAIRASSGLPGLFVPVQRQGRWLIDGGVVNPVPVSLCHALGADLVIAVNLNTDGLDVHRREREERSPPPDTTRNAEAERRDEKEILERLGDMLGNLLPNGGNAKDDKPPEPSLFDVMAGTIAIMQDRITRSRMAGEPPVVQINPRLGGMQILDFHKAAPAIDEGARATDRVAEELSYLKKLLGAGKESENEKSPSLAAEDGAQTASD
ncbi:MAG: patatin-like phospholipase RssA [Pseudomonadota bacterium]